MNPYADEFGNFIRLLHSVGQVPEGRAFHSLAALNLYMFWRPPLRLHVLNGTDLRALVRSALWHSRHVHG